ncbi:hypothetical protein D039_2202B, partial [Vibrio parahaemolyticus EKP-028]
NILPVWDGALSTALNKRQP